MKIDNNEARKIRGMIDYHLKNTIMDDNLKVFLRRLEKTLKVRREFMGNRA